MNQYQGVLGIIFVFVVAFIFSKNKKSIPWKRVAMGLGLQFVFAISILGIPKIGVPGLFRFVFDFLNNTVTKLVSFTDAGADFVFGKLAHADGPAGFVFAFKALPTIIFFSSFCAVLYYLGVLQKIILGISWAMKKTMKSSGPETLSAAANIFIGQTEAPLLIKPFIAKMTQSEIFCVMVGGMATVAAGVMGAYVQMLQGFVPDIAGHLLTASAMAAIAAIMISKILIPETMAHDHVSEEEIKKTVTQKIDGNIIEAASRGAAEGLTLALNVAAMLIAFVALIAFADWALSTIGLPSLTKIFGMIFSPVAWLIGIPWNEAPQVGNLLAQKIVLNEFVGFLNLSEIAGKLEPRTVIIASYSLCGFANFASIGIQVGGIGSLALNQRSLMAKMGLLAVLGGMLSTLLTASIAGLLF
jgi:CNT family concentrative nucleoside transporter